MDEYDDGSKRKVSVYAIVIMDLREFKVLNVVKPNSDGLLLSADKWVKDTVIIGEQALLEGGGCYVYQANDNELRYVSTFIQEKDGSSIPNPQHERICIEHQL